MTINRILKRRKITEVLHFTTNAGALGVLTTGFLIPARDLNQEDQIEFILKHNCNVRKDPAWTGHNSLSITAINSRFFEFSRAQHLHDIHIWWCVLSFDASVLAHPNVVFCTGNNTWPNSIRGTGSDGLEGLFSESVNGSYSSVLRRPASTPSNVPTCDQAEILYPGPLTVDRLAKVYVEHQDHADQLASWISLLRPTLSDQMIEVCPEKFRGGRA